jgi:hypothetical protein
MDIDSYKNMMLKGFVLKKRTNNYKIPILKTELDLNQWKRYEFQEILIWGGRKNMKKLISGKNMMKEAGVLLIAVVMLLSATTVIANKNDLTITGLSKSQSIPVNKIIEPSEGGRGVLGTVIFSQPPYGPSQWLQAFTSSSQPGYGYICQDDFWGLTTTINDIEWWGFQGIYSAGWLPGNPTGAKFEIKFYQDTGGVPGPVVTTFSNLEPKVVNLGDWGYGWTCYYFAVTLPSAVNLAAGWLSLDNTYTPDSSVMLWLDSPIGNLNGLQNGVGINDNFAFNLTHASKPDLDCTGSLGWNKVKPGDTVTGTFQVGNIGENGSLLNWKVDSWPAWGNWTFAPAAGTGLPKGSWVTVTVTIVAPPDKNTNFTGKVKLINLDNASDVCEINVYLKTPLSQNLYFQHIFERFFQRFPHAFPLLRQLLEY